MRAKQALKSLGATCEIVELDQRADGHELQRTLAEMTGRRTVPNVFIGGSSVGGSDDTVGLCVCVCVCVCGERGRCVCLCAGD